ncbi:MAG: hypothetical protein ACFFD4_05885, partial [Candidatus Odinarchaeota archaeon]
MNLENSKKLLVTVIVCIVTVSLLVVSSIMPDVKQSEEVSKSLEDVSDYGISIYGLYLDAKYAWDRLQTRKDNWGPRNTSMYFSTQVLSNTNFTDAYTTSLLNVMYAMYKLSGDSQYLDDGWEMFQEIWDSCYGTVSSGSKTGEVLFRYSWETDTVLNTTAGLTPVFPPLILEDPRYESYFDRLTDGNHKLFWSPINLTYSVINAADGSIPSSSYCHLTWGPGLHWKINVLLWMYAVTSNMTYKQWADDTIEAIWSLRSQSTNLLPREVNADSGAVIRSSVTHYDMTGFLNGLELAYYFSGNNKSAGTGRNTYFDLIDKTARAIATYFWENTLQRWIYSRSYNDPVIRSGIPEMNSFYVDYAMIRAYEITGVEEYLQKAIADFDTEFMGTDPDVPNGVLMHNSLVIHSPNTLNTQSGLSESSNTMVPRTAYLIYLYTRDNAYLRKAGVHYQQMATKHRFEKGYTQWLNTATMQPYASYMGYPPYIYDFAPYMGFLALQNAIVPSESVSIDWGYGLSTSLPTVYASIGAFTGVNVDINQRSVYLDSVNATNGGNITINFGTGSVISQMEMDGLSYENFDGNVFQCTSDTHSYKVFFTPPEEPKTTTVSTTTTGSTSTGVTGSTSTGVTGSTSTGVTDPTSTGVTGSTSTGVTGSTSTGVTDPTSTGVT